MPLELQVIRASEFIRLDVRARLDFDASKKTLQGLAIALRKRGIGRALLDLRALPELSKPQFSPTQLAALVTTFRNAGFTRQQRLAILYRTDPHRGVRIFAFLNRMRGLHVQPFTEFETALQWLSEQEDNLAEETQDEEPVRIHRDRKPKRLPIRSVEEEAPERALVPVPKTIDT
jgi:hypothetical protein